MRDVTLGETIYPKFTTRSFSTGAPTVLAGTPVVSAYEDGSLTQITAGVTLSVDHDSVVGLNMVTVVATGANGFESGKEYQLVITTGTVGGVSVVGEIIGEFTVDSSAALKAVDLLNDVAATDIVSAGAITTLSGAVVNVDLVDVLTTYTGNTPQTGDTYALANGAAGFVAIDTVVDAIKVKTDFLPSATAGGAGGVFIAGTNAATTVTTAFTSTFTGNLTGSVGSVTGAVGSVTGLTASNLDTTVSSRMAEASINTTLGAIDNVTLVATTTTNTDMRGTDNAATAAEMAKVPKSDGVITWNATALASVNAECDTAITDAALATAASISALNNVAATDIVSAGPINTLAGSVVNVDLVDVCITNTDMRGTDGANTVAPDNAGIAAVKAKTDSLTFTKAGEVDSNTTSVNSTTVTGDGQPGTEWGP